DGSAGTGRQAGGRTEPARVRGALPRSPWPQQPRDRRAALPERAHGETPRRQHTGQAELAVPGRGRRVRRPQGSALALPTIALESHSLDPPENGSPDGRRTSRAPRTVLASRRIGKDKGRLDEAFGLGRGGGGGEGEGE